MRDLEALINRIADRVNINLREPSFDVRPHIRELIPMEQFARFYAFYGLTPHHPLHFHFKNCSLAGSYFLGKCIAEHSVLYKSDIRGDELRAKGDVFSYKSMRIPLHDDEVIRIKDSFLIKTLVHSHSSDPENPEEFLIQNTVAMHYANIHGSPVEGSFLGPFATVDLTTLHDSVIGPFAYLQVGELSHYAIEPGHIWIHADGAFDFSYKFPKDVLDRYVFVEPGKPPKGIFADFIEKRKNDFQLVFDMVPSAPPIPVPKGAFLSRYAFVGGNSRIDENVLVAQRSYLENAWLGKGANAQENCYIVSSTLEGNNVAAHGAKIIHTRLGKKVFTGFNSFLQGRPEFPLSVGEGCIVMPHTIIDLEEPIAIPPRQLVWGYIRKQEDLETQSISIDALSEVKKSVRIGAMRFQGDGAKFVHAFQNRVEHILEANGAYFNSETGENKGHAQKTQSISFNTIQPYPEGDCMGLYPAMDIRP